MTPGDDLIRKYYRLASLTGLIAHEGDPRARGSLNQIFRAFQIADQAFALREPENA